MSAVARRVQYNTQVIPYNVNNITPTSIVFEEYTKTYTSTTEDVIDSAVKKSYGCSGFIDITANQVNDKWSRLDNPWEDVVGKWTEAENNWESSSDEGLTTSGEQLNTSSSTLLFAYFKNVGSNAILLSNNSGSTYLFKLSVGNALYFKPTGIAVNTIYAKSASGTSSLEYILGI